MGIYQHSHHHKSNCQIPLPPCTQIWHLCMYDPYTSTHTIIRVTVKFRHHLAPRFGTPMYVRPIYQHSHHHKSNCQIPSPACTQIWDLCVLDPYNSIHTIIRVTVKFCHQLAPRFGTSVCWTPITALTPSSEKLSNSVTILHPDLGPL